MILAASAPSLAIASRMAARSTTAGTPVLVGYVASADPEFDMAAARARLAEQLPAALVPRLVRVDEPILRVSKWFGFEPFVMRHERYRLFRRSVTFVPLSEGSPYPSGTRNGVGS